MQRRSADICGCSSGQGQGLVKLTEWCCGDSLNRTPSGLFSQASRTSSRLPVWIPTALISPSVVSSATWIPPLVDAEFR